MKKTYILELLKTTNHFIVYQCPAINGMYVNKSILPNPKPRAIRVTINTEEDEPRPLNKFSS